MKVLVLILASDNDPIYLQFQANWRRYMKSHLDVDCYFYKANPALDTEYKLDGDTLWIRIAESLDTVYEKTLKAFEYFAKTTLNQYDFVFRPNLSSFLVLDKYVQYCRTFPKNKLVAAFVGGEGPNTFPSGCGFTMSSDVVLELVHDKPPPVFLDDITIGRWLYLKRIPMRHVPRCDYVDGSGIPSYRDGNEETTFHYRIKNSDRRMDLEIHERLFHTFYKLNLHIIDQQHKMNKKIWYAPNGFQAYGDSEIDACLQCLKDGWLAGNGKYTTQFENEVASFFGKKYGLFVNSGSSACLLALASLNLPDGVEVITPACTFSTTVAPILQLGYTPVFCDVELNTYVPSVDAVLEKLTEKTRVIMLPNLIGNSPDWKLLRNKLDDICRTDVILIEDSADTMTCTPETDISTTSFYASHVITACGSGGMVMFNEAKYLKRATMFRDWGRIGDNTELVVERFNHDVDNIKYDYKFLYACLGYNFKSSEINAAFGLEQMKRLPGFLAIRRRNIERYMENLKDVPGVVLPKDKETTNWLAFPFQVQDRLALINYLEDNGIQTRVIFSGNITRHPAYRAFLHPFTNADTIMRNGILVGCHHGMTIEDVDYVCSRIKEFFSFQEKKN